MGTPLYRHRVTGDNKRLKRVAMDDDNAGTLTGLPEVGWWWGREEKDCESNFLTFSTHLIWPWSRMCKSMTTSLRKSQANVAPKFSLSMGTRPIWLCFSTQDGTRVLASLNCGSQAIALRFSTYDTPSTARHFSIQAPCVSPAFMIALEPLAPLQLFCNS